MFLPYLQTVPNFHDTIIIDSFPKLIINIHFVYVILNVVPKHEGQHHGGPEADDEQDPQGGVHQVYDVLFSLSQADEAGHREQDCPTRGN